MTRVSVLAPAKVNLTLHVTGQREDGYHLLDSLVAFAPVGDRLSIVDANTLSLTVEGPEAAGVPSDMKNLALRAAALVAGDRGAALTLEKHLPAAAGIGGGSSDAAAALRAMLAFSDQQEIDAMLVDPMVSLEPLALDILGLGADVPMCLLPRPLRAGGIGEKITFQQLPTLHAVLVNPRVPVPTPAVFQALETRQNDPMPEPLPAFATLEQATGWLAAQRNDLEQPAIAVQPAIGTVLEAIGVTEGCHLARMSGSGATCFGLYATSQEAHAAAERLRKDTPNWWIVPTWLGDCSELAQPVRC
jgi:4-diphosphocytidyl-2-C-methyl-D-erythritol kinase